MGNQWNIDHLAKFSAKEFFENISEFRGYIENKGKNVKLNPDKLINLLYIYFRSVLLYPSPDIREYRVNGPDGKLYQIEFPGHDNKGEKRIVSLAEMSNTLFAEVCSELLKSAHINHIVSLIKIFTAAITTPSLHKNHKFSIINAENTVLHEKFTDAIRMIPEKKAKEAIDVRKSLAFSELQSLDQVKVNADGKEGQNKQSLCNILIKYIQCRIDILIANNKFSDIFQLLYEELRINNDKQIIIVLLNYLVVYNNLFLLERKETIREKVAEFLNIISKEEYDQFDVMLNFSPDKIDLKDLTLEPIELDKKNVKFVNVDYQKVKTVISFVINYKSQKDYIKFEYPDNYTVEIIKPQNLFDDPVFLLLNKLQQNINGMPTTIFSDAVGNLDRSTVIHVIINEFFHPDFELVDDRITYINFEEKDAMLGRKYYPHKDRIIEILRKLYTDYNKELPFDIKREKININTISNYLVNYINENNDSIFHKVHTITNLDSYLKVKNRYIEKIAELNLSDEFLNIRELLLKTDIVTPSSFREFISRALNLTVKKSIELRGIYNFLWKDDKLDKPLNEPDIQPIIKTHLQLILEAKGIQISREVVAANGSLDFLCTYNYNGNLFKVGIELKRAHHNNLLHGLSQQLPEYLKDEGTKHGIFLVLWFKNKNFMQPAKYDSITALINDLEKNIPKKYQFNIMVIDCTKHPSPSKV